MDIKKATLFVIAGTIYTIILKMLSFIFPSLLSIDSIFKTTKILTILAILTLIIFAYYFYREYIKPNQERLKYATLFAALVPLYNILIRIKKLPDVFPELKIYLFSNVHFLYTAITTPSIENFSRFIGLIGSLLILYFFIVFYIEIRNTHFILLRKATFYMIIISCFSILVNFLAFTSYLFYREHSWILNMSEKMVFILFPIFLISSSVQIYFFWTFYKTQDISI